MVPSSSSQAVHLWNPKPGNTRIGLAAAQGDLWWARSLRDARQESCGSRFFDNQQPSILDGNKRTGHAAMEVFLILNGREIWASVDEAEEVILRVASGQMGREQFTVWIEAHLQPLR
jgi:hypothetical protein